MKRSEKVLRDNLETLHRLSNALLEREILDSDEIDKVIRGEDLPPVDRGKNGDPEKPQVQETKSPQPLSEQSAESGKTKKPA
jgi:cell division protease FtsH